MGPMSDADEVRNLLGRYCERIDVGDWDGLGDLFADGVLATEDGTVLAAGAEAVAAFYRSGTQLHDGSPRTKHLVTNTVVEPAAADGSVTARSSYLVLQAVDGFALQPIITGRYVDRFAADPDGSWHFEERRFAVDLVGDLRHHLTWDL